MGQKYANMYIVSVLGSWRTLNLFGNSLCFCDVLRSVNYDVVSYQLISPVNGTQDLINMLRTTPLWNIIIIAQDIFKKEFAKSEHRPYHILCVLIFFLVVHPEILEKLPIHPILIKQKN